MSQPTSTRRSQLLLDIPAWCTATWVTLLVLVLWSYGANNIALPGVPIPVVDIAFLLLLLRSRRWWGRFALSPSGRILLRLLVALAVVVAIRLTVDIPRDGINAARGALFAVEAWAVMLGGAVAQRIGRERTIRLLALLFGCAVLWYSLYPIRSTVVALSPTVGVRRSAKLFGFTTVGLVGSWCLLWFGLRRTTTAWIGTVLAIVVVILAQLRGALAGVIAAVAIVALAAGGTQRSVRARLARRIAVGLACGVAALALAPAMTGRLGDVTLDTYVDLARSAIGQDAGIGSSFGDRVEWFDTTIETIRDTRLGWLSGVGFGVDLTGGFGIAGSNVVNPHNDLLEFYARLGVFVLPWVAMWVVAMREFWRRSRRGDRLALWAVGAWIAMVAGSLTQPYNSFAYGGMVWWLLAGLVLGAPMAEPAATDDHPPVVQPAERAANTSR